MHGGNITTVPDYEENIEKMRVAMRRVAYLSKPERNTGLFSIDGKELNPQLENIESIALGQRQENILNVIRHNDFNFGYNSNAKFEVLKNNCKDSLEINFETQLNILIASEDNLEVRDNLIDYCNKSRNHPGDSSR